MNITNANVILLCVCKLQGGLI